MTNTTEKCDVRPTLPDAIVALAGARDRYQVPLALHEAGLLRSLVTECYFPNDRAWFRTAAAILKLSKFTETRYCPGLPSDSVRISLRAFWLNAIRRIALKQALNRHKDRAISITARRLAEKTGSAVLSYSYYASQVFKEGNTTIPHRLLFQLHPHPTTVRNILLEESEIVPSARDSLQMEHELKLKADRYADLAGEAHLANGWLAASRFTANSLADQGIPLTRIHVVPYGVDTNAFSARNEPPSARGPLRIVFVGSVIQRKGISYLLESVRKIGIRHACVTICGRGFVDERLLESYSDLNVRLRIGLDRPALAQAIRESDIMVLPSLAEGFGHVILEAMACGVPVITTKNTCGPDVINEGQHGFIVPIRDVELLTERLEWCIRNRIAVAEMGRAAAQRAREFSWHRFREGVRTAYAALITPQP